MGGVVSAACFGNVLHVICIGDVGSSIDSIISNVGGGKSQEDTLAPLADCSSTFVFAGALSLMLQFLLPLVLSTSGTLIGSSGSFNLACLFSALPNFFIVGVCCAGICGATDSNGAKSLYSPDCIFFSLLLSGTKSSMSSMDGS